MAYVVAVTLVARPGTEGRMSQILRSVNRLTRDESGCLEHRVSRSVDDPRTFFVYERYVDEVAFLADQASEHFKRLVLGEAVHLLDRSERLFLVDL
jgi:quinol monooxygenase YgiN